jgi:hypothetical protein
LSLVILESNLNSSKRVCREFIHSSERGLMILDETLLQDARAQIEAAFAQAALRDLQIDDARERAAVWRELAHTYDQTLAWWPRQGAGFRRLRLLRDWARRLTAMDGQGPVRLGDLHNEC